MCDKGGGGADGADGGGRLESRERFLEFIQSWGMSERKVPGKSIEAAQVNEHM